MARSKRSGSSIRVPRVTPQGAIHLDFIHSLLQRSGREQSGLFWAEGCRSLHSALETGRHIECAVQSRSLLKSRTTSAALRYLERIGVPVLNVTADDFRHLSTNLEPQGVGVVCRQAWEPLIEMSVTEKDIWVVLDSARTPGNLGTILRTSAATGAQGVMLIGGEADPHDPSAIRASMGAIFHQRLVRTSAKALVGWKKRHACRIVGTSPLARTHYRTASYAGPLLLMMGSERSGIRNRQLELCDEVVRLPMSGKVDSLNLAVATGVLLYEAVGERLTNHHVCLHNAFENG